MAAKIKKGDRVVVLTGKDKGRQGSVLKVLPKEDRVVVQGINLIQRHTRPTQADPQGGIRTREAALHVSNVAIVDSQGILQVEQLFCQFFLSKVIQITTPRELAKKMDKRALKSGKIPLQFYQDS